MNRNTDRHQEGQDSAYEDIIDLPHHISKRHPQMPMSDRAAQFSPFAALKGYDAAQENHPDDPESP